MVQEFKKVVGLLLLILMIGSLAAQAQQLKPEEIAINIMGFDEVTDFLVEAAAYPELEKVKWYGSDGSALSPKVTGTPAAARLAAKGVWKNPTFFSLSDLGIRVYWLVRDKVGYSPDAYIFPSYDAVWVMGLAIVAAGDPRNVDAVAELVPTIAQEIYVGASGKIVLNANGDRAGGDYATFVVREVSPNKFEWKIVSIYDFAKNAISEVKEDPLAQKPAQLPAALPSVDLAKFRGLIRATPAAAQEVTIAVLYPISGDLSGMGRANSEAVRIAVEDLNKWLRDNGFRFSFRLDIRDSETKPETAESLFRTLHAAGIRYFLGPMTSGELGRIMGTMEGAGLKAVIISPSSTSPALAKRDSVYRLPPPDDFQGKVLAQLYKADGVKSVIIVYRSDDWGKALAELTKKEAEALGIKVEQMIGYDPKSPNFKPIVEQVRSTVNRLAPQEAAISPLLIGAAIVAIIVIAAAAYFLFLRRK
ncbi:MAG: ABC transporter substrate-binding protein [Acidilobaceae archaeon]|nr:ABC transporter substrate-binding protein [Acidilobaceae archaeon]MDW7973751.1 ABC transporter substrate-binding protein [Sulfolobales archaeon]